MILHDSTKVAAALNQMRVAIEDLLRTRKIEDYMIVGIRTGGVWIAEALLERLNCKATLGTLDISFYRDDFSRNGLNPVVRPSQLPKEIENQHILLVDDVIMSGRTIRAALNELFDYGRPKSVILATLVDLNARELPIRPDVVGINMPPNPHQRVKLKGPSPLHIEQKEI